MQKTDNFVENFQEEHSGILGLVASLRSAIESSDRDKAKEILTRIDALANRHFAFEEDYLYPRLRRLVLEITGNLHNEQQTMKEFIRKSRGFLNKDRLHKDKASEVLAVLPRLSKVFKDCNDLVSLIDKFGKDDKDDLNLRFKEYCQTRNTVSV